MKICPSCHYNTRNDEESFCPDCGSILVVETQRLDPSRLPDAPPVKTKRLHDIDARPTNYNPSIIAMLAMDEFPKQPIAFEVFHPVLLGRQADTSHGASFINLDVYRAYDYGVSRRHAMIAWQDQQLTIADLNSVNFTLVNGKMLRPHHEVLIAEGDHIVLGRLGFRIYFEESTGLSSDTNA